MEAEAAVRTLEAEAAVRTLEGGETDAAGQLPPAEYAYGRIC